ncbi:RDD family protein [Roseateles sp.]|jgi:uncharacterized RDD family membrane protein YckC|uniref:RDD family protein n=1 Tax=Roseateles sp. TaxID=1971397 RepID=UPI0037C88B49
MNETYGPERPAPAGIARRMAAFFYEGMLLFGVVFTGGFVYSAATQQRHALQGQFGLQVFLFCLLGLYFAWFWSHGGQTLAMKAWHLRVLDAQGRPLRPLRAVMRYLLSWLWFLPALLSVYTLGVHGTGPIFGSLAAGVIAYAGLSWLHPRRQFLHDAVCGTELVTQLPRKKP